MIFWYLLCVLLGSEQIVNIYSTVMDDDSCVLKYIEIVPLENNAEQFEDLKPVQVKVCIIANIFVWIKDYEIRGCSILYLLGNSVECSSE